MMVGNNLKDTQLQQIVDKTILFADRDEDGKINFDEFCSVSKLCLKFMHKKVNVFVFCKNRGISHKIKTFRKR